MSSPEAAELIAAGRCGRCGRYRTGTKPDLCHYCVLELDEERWKAKAARRDEQRKEREARQAAPDDAPLGKTAVVLFWVVLGAVALFGAGFAVWALFFSGHSSAPDCDYVVVSTWETATICD